MEDSTITTTLVTFLLAINSTENSTEPVTSEGESDQSQPIGDLVFQSCVLITGAVGIVANGVVLSAMLSKELRNRANNLLIINQVSLDFYSSIMLVITFAVQMGVPTVADPWATAVCKVFYGQFLLFIGVHASITSLVFITLERYAKIVLHVYHRKYFRKWMIAVAVVICWVSGFLNTFTTLLTMYAADGDCQYDIFVFGSLSGAATYAILLIVWHYVVPTLIFIWSYVHIFITVRRSSQVGHGRSIITTVAPSSTNDSGPSLSKGQMTIIRTCMIVSTTFALCWFLNNFVYLVSVINYDIIDAIYNITNISTIIGFFTMCINPFIYAISLDGVKKRVISTVCRRHVELEPESVTIHRRKVNSSVSMSTVP